MNNPIQPRRSHIKKELFLSFLFLTFAVPYALSAADQKVTVEWSMPTTNIADIQNYVLNYSVNSDMQGAEPQECEAWQETGIEGDRTYFGMTCNSVPVVSGQLAYFTLEATEVNGTPLFSDVFIKNTQLSAVINFRILPPDTTVPPTGIPTNISDNFTGDLSNWSHLDGITFTLDTVNDELDFPDSQAGTIIYSKQQTDSTNQWVAVEMNSIQIDAYDGVYFRSTNNKSAPAYAIRGNSNYSQIAWRYCYGSSCTTIATSTAGSITENDSLGVEIEGAGSATTVRVWIWSDQGIPARGSWGTPTTIFTNDPPVLADTGKFIGLYAGNPTTSSADKFEGGSF